MLNSDDGKAGLEFAAIQINNKDATTVSQRDDNVERAIDIIRKAEEVDLFVLPELSSIGYSRDTFQKLSDLAETRDGPSIRNFSDLAKERNCYISFGFPQVINGSYYISQAVINNEGEIEDIYNKIHMAQFGDSIEKEFFKPGDRITSFAVKGVRVGLMICYDVRFPELARTLALKHNIDFLLHPVTFSRDASRPSWHPFVITRALENQIYVLSINRAGRKVGNSIFCPPWIDFDTQPQILGDGEEILYGTIDTGVIRQIRQDYTFRRDRRETYGTGFVEWDFAR